MHAQEFVSLVQVYDARQVWGAESPPSRCAGARPCALAGTPHAHGGDGSVARVGDWLLTPKRPGGMSFAMTDAAFSALFIPTAPRSARPITMPPGARPVTLPSRPSPYPSDADTRRARADDDPSFTYPDYGL